MDFLSEVQRAEASYRESGRPPTGPPPIPLPADTAVALPPEANGRRTRWTINQSSLQTLEAIFQHEQFPSQQLRTQLGAHLGVSPRQVQVWFQNRRQREKSANPGDAAPAGAATLHQPAALPGGLITGPGMPEQLAAAVLAAANNPGAPPAVEPAALATAASAEEDLVPGADESDDAEYEAQPDDDE